MGSTKASLKRSLVERLKAELSSLGFRYVTSREAFERSTPTARHIFQTRFIPHGVGFLVEPGLGVRIEEVEQYFHRTSAFDPEFHDGTNTIGGEIWRLEGTTPRRHQYPLATVDDVDRVAESLRADLREYALPYFALNSTPQAVDRLLNDEPRSGTPQRMMPWLRAATGLIAARLVGRANFTDLVKVYRENLGRVDRGFYLPQFEALVKDIQLGTLRRSPDE